MKNLFLGCVIGALLVLSGFFISEWKNKRPTNKQSAAPVEISAGKDLKTIIPQKTNAQIPTQPALTGSDTTQPMDSPPRSTNHVETLTPTEVLKNFEQARSKLSTEEEKEKLEKIKHRIAQDAPELNMLEVLRDAEVSSVRLLNKQGGKLYKFAGFILETNAVDVVIVIKNTEIVCSFADVGWKTAGLKPSRYLYACGFFESFKNEGDFRQISMANCYILENFYALNPHSQLSEEEDKKQLKEDIFYKLDRDMKGRILRRGTL